MPTPEEERELSELKTRGDAVDITEPWASAFKTAGLVSPVTGEPSIQALHRESGVHPSAISRILSGRTKKPHPETVTKIAQALDVSFIEVSRWIGLSWSIHEEWTPPKEANLLTSPQRDLLEKLIKELTKSQKPPESPLPGTLF